MLPVLYDSPHEIDEIRERFSRGLTQLIPALSLDSPETRAASLEAIAEHVNFYLGYQGKDDRKLQEQYGAMVHRIVSATYPKWVEPRRKPLAASGSKIRVGYISAHFRNHSVAKLFLGWLRESNREEFEVFAYHNGQTVDHVTDAVQRASDHFRHIPGEFESMCKAILSDELQIAVYLDVRHRRMMLMSSLRLAPVQCLAWACPITSGSPNIDYFLSSDLMEPEDGAEHYSERLVRLPGIGVSYPRPVIPRPLLKKGREHFGLTPGRFVYLCCQSIFKYLPQHDDIFVRIAKHNPSAQFVFLTLNDMVRDDFERRLQEAFAKAGLTASDYCVLLPQLSTFDYWNIHLHADVFLDSLEWSGGVTTLEAIACGLPVVTLPGQFMRGRHSYGILTQLGVTETIAHSKADYVEIALRLHKDREWRSQVLERMAAGSSRLYSDTRCVRALEDFYRKAVTEHHAAR